MSSRQLYRIGHCTFTCKRTMSTSSKIEPVKVYLEPDKEKELIVNGNKGRTGIYRWVLKESGKSYIGSSANLSTRFKQYFNYNHISYPKRNLRIYKALLKYGYAGFSLEILEYCNTDVLLQREQFYFDTLNPEYNILKVAGSPLGYRHSEASKKLISIASKNREISESTRYLKRKALLGKVWEDERIEKMRLSNTFRKTVIVTNTETNSILEFSSMTELGKYLGISRVSVRNYLLKGIPYKNYILSSPLINNDNYKADSLYNETKLTAQPVLLTNNETGDIKEFSSMADAAKYLNISRAGLWYFFNKTVKSANVTIKGYTVSKLDVSNLGDLNPLQIEKKNSKKIKVIDLETNEETIYPSFTLAAQVLDVKPSSLSGYFLKKRTNPFKKRYSLSLV
uniref:hypothetical protein n=1 Tax=Dematophora necatrix TaxID=2751867 RepID=UPI0030E2B6C2